MRRWPIWVVATFAGTGALAAGSLRDGHATFLTAHDGRVRQAAAVRSARPPGAAVSPGASWFVVTRGHLILGHGRWTVWRSPGPGWSARHLGVVLVGRHRFAFQYAHRLYMGPFDGGARAVARRELPLGWSGRRLYTNSYPRRALFLRGPTGRLLQVLSPLPFHSDPVLADGSVYLILGGGLMRARGAPAKRVTSLSALGMSADSWLAPVGRLLELQDNRSVRILRPDGSVFASTALPRRDGRPGTMSSSLVLDPHGHAVAFTAAYGESIDPSAVTPAHGHETVFLLKEGARTATPVHTEDVRFRVCERGASVQWHGSWLLYENSEGNRALVNTAPPRLERRRRHSGGV